MHSMNDNQLFSWKHIYRHVRTNQAAINSTWSEHCHTFLFSLMYYNLPITGIQWEILLLKIKNQLKKINVILFLKYLYTILLYWSMFFEPKFAVQTFISLTNKINSTISHSASFLPSVKNKCFVIQQRLFLTNTENLAIV